MALPPQLQPRARVEYKRPRRLNVVSIGLMLTLAAAVYAGWAMWPAFQLRASVKNELQEALPQLWRLNLRPQEWAGGEIVQLKRDLTDKLRKMGVQDKKLEVVFDRRKDRVGIEARFTTVATFPVWDKKITLHFTPRAETDAARIEW